jgi:hypothetical protein
MEGEQGGAKGFGVRRSAFSVLGSGFSVPPVPVLLVLVRWSSGGGVDFCIRTRTEPRTRTENRRTPEPPNAERRTPNAERRTPNALLLRGS